MTDQLDPNQTDGPWTIKKFLCLVILAILFLVIAIPIFEKQHQVDRALDKSLDQMEKLQKQIEQQERFRR